MTENAAERFYKDSHERNTGVAPIPMLARELAAAELLGSAHRYRCVFEHLQSDPGKAVVELGFGSPRLLAALAHGCASYTIVDIVDRTSAADLPANVAFQQADLCCDFPFADASFDCAVAMMIVEHLFHPFHSFRELARITIPGREGLRQSAQYRLDPLPPGTARRADAGDELPRLVREARVGRQPAPLFHDRGHHLSGRHQRPAAGSDPSGRRVARSQTVLARAVVP